MRLGLFQYFVHEQNFGETQKVFVHVFAVVVLFNSASELVEFVTLEIQFCASRVTKCLPTKKSHEVFVGRTKFWLIDFGEEWR